jgi:hypothetical protein
MTTEVVAPGPGSHQVDDLGWEASLVQMRYEDVAPEYGTDTIAVLELNSIEDHTDHPHTTKVSVQIELTLGDGEELLERLKRTLEKNTGWRTEHEQTEGQHYGLNGPGTSAYALCPSCRMARR